MAQIATSKHIYALALSAFMLLIAFLIFNNVSWYDDDWAADVGLGGGGDRSHVERMTVRDGIVGVVAVRPPLQNLPGPVLVDSDFAITPPPTRAPAGGAYPKVVGSNALRTAMKQMSSANVRQANTKGSAVEKPSGDDANIDFVADYDVGSVAAPSANYPRVYAYTFPVPRSIPWTMQWLSQRPHVAMVQKFMTGVEAHDVQAVALQHGNFDAKPNNDHARPDPAREAGGGTSATLPQGHPAVLKLLDRIGALFGKPFVVGDVVATRFAPKQNKVPQPAPMGKFRRNGEWVRQAATAVVFLNSVADGGFVTFPFADGKAVTEERRHETRHAVGLRVAAKQGTLVVSYNVLPDFGLDSSAASGVIGPTSGEAWHVTIALCVPVPPPVSTPPSKPASTLGAHRDNDTPADDVTDEDIAEIKRRVAAEKARDSGDHFVKPSKKPSASMKPRAVELKGDGGEVGAGGDEDAALPHEGDDDETRATRKAKRRAQHVEGGDAEAARARPLKKGRLAKTTTSDEPPADEESRDHKSNE